MNTKLLSLKFDVTQRVLGNLGYYNEEDDTLYIFGIFWDTEGSLMRLADVLKQSHDRESGLCDATIAEMYTVFDALQSAIEIWAEGEADNPLAAFAIELPELAGRIVDSHPHAKIRF